MCLFAEGIAASSAAGPIGKVTKLLLLWLLGTFAQLCIQLNQRIDPEIHSVGALVKSFRMVRMERQERSNLAFDISYRNSQKLATDAPTRRHGERTPLPGQHPFRQRTRTRAPPINKVLNNQCFGMVRM